jgi:hypothetical protein
MAGPRTDYERFANLTFDGFRELATADGLSRYQRIGFPDAYRDGYEAAIYRDVLRKLTNLNRRDQIVFDIGCGCSDLPFLLATTCDRQGHTLVLSDSAEMLAHLPDEPFVRKAPGCFPRDSAGVVREYAGRVDAILIYSVLQYVFADLPLFDFVDTCLTLLAPGGQLLIGDVPNVSKRKRFFTSAAGVRCHQQFTGTGEVPTVAFNVLERAIDDAVVFSILGRARAAGFDAYVVPQAADLPMANRREDILIARP